MNLYARGLPDDQQTRAGLGAQHRVRAQRERRLAESAGADARQQGIEFAHPFARTIRQGRAAVCPD
jgi:hypothetical protein